MVEPGKAVATKGGTHGNPAGKKGPRHRVDRDLTPRIPSTRHPKFPKTRNMRKAHLPIAMHKLKNAGNWNKRQNMPRAQA